MCEILINIYKLKIEHEQFYILIQIMTKNDVSKILYQTPKAPEIEKQ